MSTLLRCIVLLACALPIGPTLPSAMAAGKQDKLPAQMLGLRVTVDATGKVQSSRPIDPQAAPGLNQAAAEIARKLSFTPARKNGVAVASETSLTLTLALEPRGDGQFGLQLRRAINGPGVLTVGKMVPPRYQQGKEKGALVVVGVDLRADGSVDLDTLKAERMELRVPSSFAEARYLDAIKTSLRGSRFELDKIDGVVVPAHVSVPYRFGGGPTKPKRGEEESRGGDNKLSEMELPSWNALSTVPGIDLARIDFRAPAQPSR